MQLLLTNVVPHMTQTSATTPHGGRGGDYSIGLSPAFATTPHGGRGGDYSIGYRAFVVAFLSIVKACAPMQIIHHASSIGVDHRLRLEKQAF